MAILKHVYHTQYTVLPNGLLQNRHLSFKARGILAFLRSQPEQWDISIQRVTDGSDSDGYTAVRSGLRELETLGYLKYTRVRIEGKFVDVEWIVTDTPQEGFEKTSESENPLMESPIVENLSMAPPPPLLPPDVSPQTPLLIPPSLSPPIPMQKSKQEDKSKTPPYPPREHFQEHTSLLRYATHTVLEHLNTTLHREYRNGQQIQTCLRAGASLEECCLVIDWLHIVRRARDPEWVEQYLDNVTPFRLANFDKYRASAQAWDLAGRPHPVSQGRDKASQDTLAKLYAVQRSLDRLQSSEGADTNGTGRPPPLSPVHVQPLPLPPGPRHQPGGRD